MKIDCIIPTRGDRQEFVDFARKQMESQTLKPDEVDVIDYPPADNKNDIASRYKVGIDRRIEAGADVIFFIEDDDFYCKNYIESMIQMWSGAGKPDLFGIEATTYYHLGARMFGTQVHAGRASMYSTIISRNLDISIWPKDPEPFVDLKIWKQQKNKKSVMPPFDIPICLGIKHGFGKCGGGMHDKNRFTKTFSKKGKLDPDLKYLQEITGPGFWFYKSIINQGRI